MKTTIQKWGNSLAVRIPSALAKLSNISNNTVVEILYEENKIILKPASPTPCSLKALVAKITPKNRHREVTVKGPLGHEEW